jgi:hypothetical protein
MFGAISWRRANRWGALAGLVVSSWIFFQLTWSDYGVLLQWEAANFGWSLLAGFAALAAVSLATPPEPEDKLTEFYDRLDRPSQLDGATGEEVAVEGPGHDLLFVHLFDLGLTRGWKSFYERFRVDLNGLIVACGVVVLLIALAKGVLYLP